MPRKKPSGRTQALLQTKKANEKADVIMFAVFYGDESAADKFSLGVRTIQRYRKQAIEEQELAGIVAYRLSLVDNVTIPDDMSRTISGMLKAANHLTTIMTAGTNMPKAEDLMAFAEIMKIVFSYDLNRKQLHMTFGITDGVTS